jgi:hypothetical protein
MFDRDSRDDISTRADISLPQETQYGLERRYQQTMHGRPTENIHRVRPEERQRKLENLVRNCDSDDLRIRDVLKWEQHKGLGVSVAKPLVGGNSVLYGRLCADRISGDSLSGYPNISSRTSESMTGHSETVRSADSYRVHGIPDGEQGGLSGRHRIISSRSTSIRREATGAVMDGGGWRVLTRQEGRDTGNRVGRVDDYLERDRREPIIKRNLMELGFCPRGWQWNRDPRGRWGGGWACSGGHHYVSDAELEALGVWDDEGWE